MNNILMIGVFIVVEILMNRLVSLIFRFMEKKHNSVHLRFTKSFVNVLISVILCYTLLQQFELTRDISKVLLQSGSLMSAIATFAAQQALGNVISGISLSVSKPYNEDDKIRVVQGGSIIAEGIVKDITIRHTIIRQYNGECCIVPNYFKYRRKQSLYQDLHCQWHYSKDHCLEPQPRRQFSGLQRYPRRPGRKLPGRRHYHSISNGDD